jgi:hypothetical protein
MALRIVGNSNSLAVSGANQEVGTLVAHCFDVKIVLHIPATTRQLVYIDVWHQRLVMSMEWVAEGQTKITKFSPGKWEERIRFAASKIESKYGVSLGDRQ